VQEECWYLNRVVDDVLFVAFGFLFVLVLYGLNEQLFLMQLSECVRFFFFR